MSTVAAGPPHPAQRADPGPAGRRDLAGSAVERERSRRRSRLERRLAWAHRQFEAAEARIRELDAELDGFDA